METEEQKRKDWEDALKPYGLKLVHSKTDAFKNIGLIVFMGGFMILGSIFVYLLGNGKLTPQIDVNPQFDNINNVNASSNTANLYEFKPTTNNDNEYTIVVDLSDLECIGYQNDTS